MTKIRVKVYRIVFHNNEDGFTILKGDIVGKLEEVSIKCGGMIDPTENIEYEFEGNYENNTKYGKTFIANSYKEAEPDSLEAVRAYLSSGFFRGIGPVLAFQIVDKFGKDSIKVIESRDKKLLDVSGIGKIKAQSIWDSWDEHKSVRDITLFLGEFGVSLNFILKIYRKYGDKAIETIKANPYQLIYDIEGLGFLRVDEIARKIGIAFDSIERAKAGIIYILNETTNDGNVYLPEVELIKEAKQLLCISEDIIKEAIKTLINEDYLKKDEGSDIYLKSLYCQENNVASTLRYMSSSKDIMNIDNFDSLISLIEKEIGITYDDIQRNGIKTALTSKISVITGGPGTGKTTILLGVIRILLNLGYTIGAAAPTGKAAKRMSEVTGLNASTIHRLLQYQPGIGFKYNEDNTLPYNVIIVDESSMINITLMDVFLKAVNNNTKLILVGDVDQLPAIGPGNVLSDIINSGIVPVVKLDKIYRQAENSDIVVNAHRVNHGEMPINRKTDFYFIKEHDNQSVNTMIKDLIKQRLPNAYKVKPIDIQVLSPMRKYDVGSVSLNNIIQGLINPKGTSVNYGECVYRVNDKVMQIKNNYDKGIFNGETGFIKKIDEEEKTVTIDFDGNIVDYNYGELSEISLAYAATIHKSQGSEYPIVVIPIVRGHYRMMERNLLYTAITRAKDLCIIIGDYSMIERAVNNVTAVKRYTKLKEKLYICKK